MAQRITMDQLLEHVGELPPIPQVAQRALQVIRNPQSNMAELAELLSLDEAMTSLVLRWSNSSYYGLRYPVATVQQAVVYLGHRTLHSLILAASVASILNRAVPGYHLERGQLWRHSLGTAVGARTVAAQFGAKLAEEAYHAGLLCDIGKLAMDMLLRRMPEYEPDQSIQGFNELETEYFGFDHAQLGAEMACRWGLPAALVDAIANHHSPSEATDGRILADAVHLSDAAMMMMGIGIGRDGLQYVLDPGAIERMNWDEQHLMELSEQVVTFIEETSNILLV